MQNSGDALFDYFSKRIVGKPVPIRSQPQSRLTKQTTLAQTPNTEHTARNTTVTQEIIKSWPKAELHCHLDGSLRLSTMLEEAKKQGKLSILPADSVEGLQRILKEIDASDTLEAYLSWFKYSIPIMQSRESLRRIAYELAEDNAAENVRYLEVRFAPILHREEGLTLEAVMDAVLDGLKQAEKDFGMTTSVIICGLRDSERSL